MVKSFSNSLTSTAAFVNIDNSQKQLHADGIIEGNDEDLTLFNLMQQSKWDEASAHVTSTPLSARRWIIKARETGWRRLPLHEACVRLATRAFIGILIEAYPEAVQKPDHSGRLPVHHACFHGASLETVEKLVLLFPESLKVRDIWGKDPVVVARGTASSNRDDVIAALSRGSEFYRKEALKEEWSNEQEMLQKMRIRQYQELIQMQEMKINASLSDISEKCQEFELLQSQHTNDFNTLTERGVTEKKKFLEVISSIKDDVGVQQTLVDHLSLMVQRKDQRIAEIEQRLRMLHCDLVKTGGIKQDMKEELMKKEQEFVSLTDSLQEALNSNQHLSAEASKLSLFATRQTIALNKEKRTIDARQREISLMQEHNQEVSQQCKALTETVEQQQGTINSFTDKLRLLDAEKDKKMEELSDKTHLLENLNRLIGTKDSEIESLDTLACKKAKLIEGRNAHLENERGKLSQRILLLQEEIKRLELKTLTRQGKLRRTNEELLRNQLEVANALIRALQDKAAETVSNARELSSALEEEKRRNLSLQQEITDSTKNFQAITHLQDEKEALMCKIVTLDSAVDALKNDWQEARSARNLILLSFKDAMKKAGEDQIKILNQLAVHATHESTVSPFSSE